MKLLIASIWFELCWLSAVLGTHQWQWLTLAATIVTLIYCWRVNASSLKCIAVITALGVALDTVNQQFSILVFPTQWLPVWLLCLWFLFPWYVYQLKSVLYRFPKIYVSIIGGLGGTVSYFAGHELHAVEFGFSTGITLAILFLEWFVFMLLILRVYGNEKLDDKLETKTEE